MVCRLANCRWPIQLPNRVFRSGYTPPRKYLDGCREIRQFIGLGSARIAPSCLKLISSDSKLGCLAESTMDVLISAEQIRNRLDEVAGEIARVYDGRPVTAVGIL